jgi:hypothetical protein
LCNWIIQSFLLICNCCLEGAYFWYYVNILEIWYFKSFLFPSRIWPCFMFTVHASTICSCVSIEYVNLHCQQKYRQLYLLVINCILGWRCKSTWVSKFSWEGNVCVERRIGFQHLFESSIWNAAQQLAPRKFVITTSWKLTVPSNTSHLTH